MIRNVMKKSVIKNKKLQNTLETIAKSLSGNDFEFFKRVWKTDLEVYRARLKTIRFVDLENVLDAGCGMGQWTLCLDELNGHVCALDSIGIRVEIVRQIMEAAGVNNADVRKQSIETIDYPDDHFDGIFCYGVLMMTNYRRTLREFYRVLKPGGKVYLSNTGLGWYLYNLITPYNPAEDYDPRKMAVEAFENTLAFFAEGVRTPGRQLILPSQLVKKEMGTIGFKEVRVGGEGTLQLDPTVSIQSFFPAQHYGLENVYEVLAWCKASTG